jgi:hypothetical protein
LWIVTESEATGALAGAAGADEGMLMPEGIAVGSGDGDPVVPANPASRFPLAGLIAALAGPPPLPHAASSTVLAAPAAATVAHQRRLQRR